jgi:hypothetical protein
MDVNFMIKRIAVSNLSLAVLLGVSVPVNAGMLSLLGKSVEAPAGSAAEHAAPLRKFNGPSVTATDTAKAMVPSADILDLSEAESLVSARKAIDAAKAKAAEARDADVDWR